MTRRVQVPWPEQWSGLSRARSSLVVAGPVVLCVVAVGTATRHYLINWGSGFKYVAMFALLFAELAVLVADARLRIRKAGTKPLRLKATKDGVMSLEMPYSRIQFSLYALLMLSASLPFVFGVVGALEMENPLVGRSILLIVAALIPLSLPITMLVGAFALGRVQLAPDGIYQRGWTHESFLPWDGVAEVRAVPWDGPEIWVVATVNTRWKRRQIARIWLEDRLPDRAILRIPGRDLAGDPALLYELLRYYHEHAEARAELGTQAEFDNARAGAVRIRS